MLNPVSITSEAIKEIKNILEHKGIPADYGLRLGVKGGGCRVTFKLGFDQKKPGDVEYFVETIRVLIQKKEAMFMVGKKISFYDEVGGRGFMFEDDQTV